MLFVRSHQVGDKVTISYYRGNDLKKASVTLTAKPSNRSENQALKEEEPGVAGLFFFPVRSSRREML